MTYAIIALLCVCLLLLVVLIGLSFRTKKGGNMSREDKNYIIDFMSNNLEVMTKSVNETQRTNNDAIRESLREFKENLNSSIESLDKRTLETTKQLVEQIQNMSKMQNEALETLRLSNERNIRAMQEDNKTELEKINKTVSEKLDETINKRFNESFKLLSGQLESVYKSLDEMQKIGTEVGSLTKVLSNVKTTGIFGEVQLGAIFDQILTQEQYETNFVTGEGREPVEFAVKLPGNGDEVVYMPVDSKFPFKVYSDLQEAYDQNNFDEVKTKKEQLKNTIRSMAKDIQTKYICPPKTTNFAVMFLPVEGLYAEVAKSGMIEELQEKYNVTIAGPTTFSALLNSLKMGFNTLAIQKKSSEVWKILGAVRTEFDKFSKLVQGIQKQFEKTSKDFDTLVGTRTRMLSSKLSKVDRLTDDEAEEVLSLPAISQDDQTEE